MAGAAQPVNRRTVRVDAASRGYDVLVGAGILNEIGAPARVALPTARRAAVFFDHGLIHTHTLDTAADSLRSSGFEVIHTAPMVFTPSEQAKCWANVGLMLATLTSLKLERNDIIVSIGGGVLGDMAGFAAATYRRGLQWINIPTTLLSMVDASVGGKTGANLSVDGSLKKNMVGAFWQPSLVVADVSTLSTLPDRHVRAGLAECLKHGMLSAGWNDPGLGAWTKSNLTGILSRDPASLVELVARNIAVKAAVVAEDEREEAPDADGGRALLNLGHTFGHVLESLPDLNLLHGEAVALGLIAASAAAEALSIAPRGLTDRTRQQVLTAGLPARLSGLPGDDALSVLMSFDKKVTGGKMRLVLPRGDGTCMVTSDADLNVVRAGWTAIRSTSM